MRISPTAATEFMARLKPFAGKEADGPPLLNPLGAVTECLKTAEYYGAPVIRAAISKQWRESYTEERFPSEMYQAYDQLLRGLPTVLPKAEVFLWSREMKELSHQAADSYPFSNADRWTPELLGVDPQKLTCLYWAQEVDWGFLAPEGMKLRIPDDSTIFSMIIIYAPSRLADPIRRSRDVEQTGKGTINAFNILCDHDTALNMIIPFLDNIQEDSQPSHGEGAERQLYGMLQFLKSPYIGFVKHAIPRPMRRAAERKQIEMPKAVRVIVLRRKASDGRDVSEQDDWTCRWIVRGHWRNQWYRSTQLHHPVWIAPYVKGPENKPLKMPTKDVFAVRR